MNPNRTGSASSVSEKQIPRFARNEKRTPNKHRSPVLYSGMPRAAFDLQAPFQPAGDQPKAIAELRRGLEQGERFLVRLALEGNDRRGLYADVAAAVSATGTDIKSMDLRSSDGKTIGSVLVEVENLAHLQKIVKAARRVKGISEVARRERLTPE